MNGWNHIAKIAFIVNDIDALIDIDIGLCDHPKSHEHFLTSFSDIANVLLAHVKRSRQKKNNLVTSSLCFFAISIFCEDGSI